MYSCIMSAFSLFPKVAKVIQKLASTSSVDVRESYMKPLELFVRKHHEGLKVRGGRKGGCGGGIHVSVQFYSSTSEYLYKNNNNISFDPWGSFPR